MIFLNKIKNTFLYPRFLFKYLINNESYKSVFKKNLKRSWVKKLIYFYPSVMDSSTWALGAIDAYRNPQDFLKLRENLDNFFIENFCREVSLDAKILDLGCNTGRHLAALYSRGYQKLNGVDVMAAAFDSFKENFPDAYKAVSLSNDFFQRFLLNEENDKYDVLYTIGATIELVHPSFDILAHMARVTKSDIFLLIQPDAHSYPRFYCYEFQRVGFLLQHMKKLGKNHCFYHFKKFN